MLRRDELDAALVSVTEVLFNDRYDVLDGVAIASLGEVKSVFVAHRYPLAEVHEIFYDVASLTSVNLLKVLMAERGLKAELIPLPDYEIAPSCDAVLLIGDRAIDFVRSMIDAAGTLGAPVIVGSMQGRLDEKRAMAPLEGALHELARHAERHGVPLLFEPLNRYETNVVTTLIDGAMLVRGLRLENVKLLADLFHMNIEERDMAASIRFAGELVGHVHFADSNRQAPGRGHIDFVPIATALQDIGYKGYLSAEALRGTDSDDAARQTMKAFHQFFS